MSIQIFNRGPAPLDAFNAESPNGHRIYEVFVCGKSVGKFIHKRDKPVHQLFKEAAKALSVLPGKRFDESCLVCDGRGWNAEYVKDWGNERRWRRCNANGCTAKDMPKPELSPYAFDNINYDWTGRADTSVQSEDSL